MLGYTSFPFAWRRHFFSDPKSLANAWRFNSQPCTTRIIRPIFELPPDFLKLIRIILVDKRFQTLFELFNLTGN